MREPDSKVTRESLLQWMKHSLEIASIDEGMQINRSEDALGDKSGALPKIENRTTNPS
jgi:hypothetical protein